MKKSFIRFITMLILIVMALEVVLPKNTYGTEESGEPIPGFISPDSEYGKFMDGMLYGRLDEYFEWFTVDSNGWYQVTAENKNNTMDASINPVPSEHNTIFYFDDYGNYVEPLLDKERSSKDIYTYYLNKGKGYWKFKDVVIGDEVGAGIAEELKEMIARFMYSIANGLHYLVGKALGESLTIDDLVFNNYKETNISYFETREEAGDLASSLVYGTSEVGGLNTVVNNWYAIFLKISLMGYMVMLVYMGLRIMLTATADEKANYKKLFTDWVIGLAILLLFPYAMKYMIKINNAFVETIEANGGLPEQRTSSVDGINFEKGFLEMEIDHEIDWSYGTDYMSKIAFSAYITEEPALALAFLIMTWQLIVLVFHYYKRLFTIAFLIIIFPLVGLFYAIDKIGDGKSQAFNTWAKEFILNVFVQTFHAIVYVFVCSTVYSAVGEKLGGVGYDFILVIVGVTFLFSGEAIIRQIFGQVSSAGTMKNLSESAAATFAKFKAVEGAIKTVGDYTVGKKSIPRKLHKGATKLRAANARLKAYDKTATKQEDFNTGMRLEHAPEDPGKDATAEQKKNFLKERSLFNAAAICNNPNSHSKQEVARAQEKLKQLAKENPDHDVFKDTKMTAGQFAALANLDNDVERMVNSGMQRLDIRREVTARLGIIFPDESEEKLKNREATYYTGMYLSGVNNTVSRTRVKREIDNIMIEARDLKNSFEFSDGTRGDLADEKIVEDTVDIYERYDDSSLSEDEKDRAKEFSMNLAILNSRGSGDFTEEELLDAAEYVRDHRYDNEVTDAMSEELDGDADMFVHVLAKKVYEESESEDAKNKARGILKDYEDDARDGYFDDEVSMHEVIKNMKNEEALNDMIEELYQNKKQAMKEATEEIAGEYLVENEVDIMKGSYDTDVVTQDGLTESEIIATKLNIIGETLGDIAAVNQEGASEDSTGGLFGWAIKEYLARKEEERTGITRSMEDRKDIYNPMMSSQDFIEKNKRERDKIQNEHFMGDIGDRKD